MIKNRRRGLHPISQYVDVTKTNSFVALRPLSGFRLVRPEDESIPRFLTADSEARELGAALIEALGRCRYVPPEDRDFYDMDKYYRSYMHSENEILRRMGKRTKTDAYKDAIWCRVQRVEGEIQIQPFRPAARGTWKMLPEEMRVSIPETTDPDAVGAALNLAFERGATFEG